MQKHHASAALHWVSVPSQVREVPGTLVHEVVGLQVNVAYEQVVVHVVEACTEATDPK